MLESATLHTNTRTLWHLLDFRFWPLLSQSSAGWEPSLSARSPCGRWRRLLAPTSWPHRPSGKASGWTACSKARVRCSARSMTPCWRCHKISRQLERLLSSPSSWPSWEYSWPSLGASAPTALTNGTRRLKWRSRPASSSWWVAFCAWSRSAGAHTPSSETSTTPFCLRLRSGSWGRRCSSAGARLVCWSSGERFSVASAQRATVVVIPWSTPLRGPLQEHMCETPTFWTENEFSCLWRKRF